MHGGALAQKASKQKELSDHKLVKASNKRHGGGYSACALDIYTAVYICDFKNENNYASGTLPI